MPPVSAESMHSCGLGGALACLYSDLIMSLCPLVMTEVDPCRLSFPGLLPAVFDHGEAPSSEYRAERREEPSLSFCFSLQQELCPLWLQLLLHRSICFQPSSGVSGCWSQVHYFSQWSLHPSELSHSTLFGFSALPS